MIRAGAIEDYTFLWWDVRPHPNLGTVETRIFDQPTRLEDTVGFAALTVALAHRFATLWDAEEPLVEQPTELIDDNKVRACVRAMEGNLVDFHRGRKAPARELAHRLLTEIDPSVEALGVREQLAPIHRILAEGTGARAQLDFADANGGDLRTLVRERIALAA
jgi:carboxylate-amine ligase